jgi:hypothetical protein
MEAIGSTDGDLERRCEDVEMWRCEDVEMSFAYGKY